MDKASIRERVWEELRKVALPDSRFHFDFESFIPDYEGSARALDRLVGLEEYRECRFPFITPDNCLEDLRCRLLMDGKRFAITTYGIYRGFVVMDPEKIEPEDYRYAATLDGMEKVGIFVDLKTLKTMGAIDLVVTGASAISRNGVRFGKGHGFFDLEWGMLYTIGLVDVRTPTVAFVHDCQVANEMLEPSEFDSVCDFIVTPSELIRIDQPQKPQTGILWNVLQPGMLEAIPPLLELKKMQS